jgi:hypothetical protein
MDFERRTILAVVVAVLVVGTGVVTATGSLGAVPVVGPLLDGGCGPGETGISAINDGDLAGETVVIQGKLDYSLAVEDPGITAFRLDGQTGTVPVYLERHPGEDMNFGDCLRVRGAVANAGADMEVDGPVVANATVPNL